MKTRSLLPHPLPFVAMYDQYFRRKVTSNKFPRCPFLLFRKLSSQANNSNLEASVADLSTYDAAFATTGKVSVRGEEQATYRSLPPTHVKLPNETAGPITGKQLGQYLHVCVTAPFSNGFWPNESEFRVPALRSLEQVTILMRIQDKNVISFCVSFKIEAHNRFFSKCN